MNVQRIEYNKSNLRIAPNNNSPSPINTSTLVVDLTASSDPPISSGYDILFNNNNNNNNNSNRNNNNDNINSGAPNAPFSITARFANSSFASSQSSPSLEDTFHTIFIATLNVRGINNVTKFDNIMNNLFEKDLSIIDLTETLLNESSAKCMFKNRCALRNSLYPYRAYWDYNPYDRNSGVSIIVKSFVSTYVQKITHHMSRYIAIDLFLPSRKLRIINIYNQQIHKWSSTTSQSITGKALCDYTKLQI